MAATFNWGEDNGTQTGSPVHGTTRGGFSSSTGAPTDVNWKSVDDNTANGGTAFTAAAVQAGNNSFTKYQYGRFSGTFNQVFNGLFAHTAGVLPTGCTLKGTVTSSYATPSASTNAALTTDMSTAISIASGLAVQFSLTGPEGGTTSNTLAAAGYSQYLATQMQTAAGATQGDSGVVTLSLQYNEN